LDRTIGGPSAPLVSPDNRRRTFYAAVSRHDLDSLLRLFDFPDPNVTSDTRTVTTVPLQQLFVLNSEFMIRQSKALADRLTGGDDASDTARIRRAFLTVYGRPPSEQELKLGLQFVGAAKSEQLAENHRGESTGSQSASSDTGLSKWEQYAQVLLGANEFMYVD